MQKQRRRRHKQLERKLSSLETIIIGLGIATGLSSIVAYLGEVSLPGRPVVTKPFSQVASMFSLLISITGILASLTIIRHGGKIVGIIAVALYLLVFLGQWWAPFLASILLLLLALEYWFEIGTIAVLFASVLLVLRPVDLDIAIIGAIIGFSELLVSLVIGIFIAMLMVLVSPRKPRYGVSRNYWLSERRVGLILLLVSAILGIAAVMLPHFRYGFNEVILYDTYYNMRFCRLYSEGNYVKAFLGWQRPLYTLLVIVPSSIGGCKPWFFDVVVPLVGFILLVIASWVLLLLETGSYSIAGIASLLAIGYWAPFFLYAGLQTNLLILPAALFLAYYILNSNGMRSAIILSILIGLWHPWTLAYYTAALLLSIAIWRRDTGKLVLRTLYSLAPGWLIYGLIVITSGKAGIASTAHTAVSRALPLLWSLRTYVWGTMIRPDILFPLTLAMLQAYLAMRRMELPLWLLGVTAMGFLGLLLPNSELLVRFLVNTPFPLVLALIALSHRRGLSIIALLASSIIALLYFIESIHPVIMPPH